MKKKKLLDIIGKSLLKVDHPKLYEKYYHKIEDLLFIVPDNYVIKSEDMNADLKRCLHDVNAFNIFIRENGEEEVKTKLIELCEFLGCWAKANVRSGQLAMVDNMNRRRHFFTVLFVGVLITVLIVSLVFTILSFQPQYKAKFEMVPDILGMVDLAFGILFFLYEFISDKKTKAFIKDSEKVANGGEPSGLGKKYKRSANIIQIGIFNSATIHIGGTDDDE